MRLGLSLPLLVFLTGTIPAQQAAKPSSIETPQARFTDVTSALGVHFQYIASHTASHYLLETMGAGVALFDYDNDGRLDIFLVNGAPIKDPTPKGSIPQKTGPDYWNRLYHQKNDGTFEDVTEKAGLQGAGYGMGVAVGDYDNDGYEDLYVTAYGGNKLYHNNGDGTFTDVTEKSGVGGGGWSTSAAWVDLDNDGFLDLVVLRYVQWDFEDIWCGEHKEGYRSYCHPDYFQPISPLVYHNKGNGTFEEVGLASGIAADGDGRTYAGMGVDFADYNNDGLPDLVITDLANQMYALYKNNGDGSFSYASFATGLGRITRSHSGWGVRFMDYSNVGWKGLLIAQGHDLDTVELNYPNLHYREPMLLVQNTGQGFVDLSPDSGSIFHEAWLGRGLAMGDIDNDGRLDAVVTTNDGPVHILHNETQTANHWLTLKLIGHKSNRDAIGAEIKLVTGQGPQFATVTTASSYLSSSDKRVHFGLGLEPVAATVEIHWPSGIVQTLRDVPADHILQIDEPSAGK